MSQQHLHPRELSIFQLLVNLPGDVPFIVRTSEQYIQQGESSEASKRGCIPIQWGQSMLENTIRKGLPAEISREISF